MVGPIGTRSRASPGPLELKPGEKAVKKGAVVMAVETATGWRLQGAPGVGGGLGGGDGTDGRLAAPGTWMAAMYTIVGENRLDPSYPQAVLRQVEGFQAHDGIMEPMLEDMTALPFVTIDNDHSMDLDQAMHIRREKKGFVVSYALADGAFYVPAGTPLFQA